MSEINFLLLNVSNCLQDFGLWYGDLLGGKHGGLQNRAQLKEVSAVLTI
jgi:hypothetical protein